MDFAIFLAILVTIVVLIGAAIAQRAAQRPARAVARPSALLTDTPFYAPFVAIALFLLSGRAKRELALYGGDALLLVALLLALGGALFGSRWHFSPGDRRMAAFGVVWVLAGAFALSLLTGSVLFWLH